MVALLLIGAATMMIVGTFLAWNDMISIGFGALSATGIRSTAGQQILAAGILIAMSAMLQMIFPTKKYFMNTVRIFTAIITVASIAVISYQWVNFTYGSSDMVQTRPGIGLYLVLIAALLATALQFFSFYRAGQKLVSIGLVLLVAAAFFGGAHQSHRYLQINDPNGYDDDNTGPMPADVDSGPDVIQDK